MILEKNLLNYDDYFLVWLESGKWEKITNHENNKIFIINIPLFSTPVSVVFQNSLKSRVHRVRQVLAQVGLLEAVSLPYLFHMFEQRKRIPNSSCFHVMEHHPPNVFNWVQISSLRGPLYELNPTNSVFLSTAIFCCKVILYSVIIMNSGAVLHKVNGLIIWELFLEIWEEVIFQKFNIFFSAEGSLQSNQWTKSFGRITAPYRDRDSPTSIFNLDVLRIKPMFPP